MRKIMYLLTFCICFMLGGFTASAETYGDYEYSVNEDDTVTITKYNGTDADVVIPDEIDGMPVTEIGEKSFMDNTDLETVSIGENVSTIGGHAFYRCTKLGQVEISDTVEVIGEFAFCYCSSLETIDLPSSLKSTGMDFLGSTYALKSISIEENENGYYVSDDILYKDTFLIKYPSNKKGEVFVIPNGITEIRMYSLASLMYVKTLIIPNTVEYVGGFSINGSANPLTVVFAHTSELPKTGNSIVILGSSSTIKVKNEALKEIVESWRTDKYGTLGQFKGTIEVDPAPFPATALTFVDGTTEKSMDIELTSKYQCEWEMLPYGASDSVTWTSSNPTVATVDAASGLVQCIGVGEAVITGRDEHGHILTLNVNGYVDFTGLKATAWDRWEGELEATEDFLKMYVEYDPTYATPYRASYYLNVTWEKFKEKVPSGTTLDYGFAKNIEIVNSNPEVLDVVYSDENKISDTERKFIYDIKVKSLGESTVYARITNYDGTVYETPKVTYGVYMDMSYWDSSYMSDEWIEISGVAEYEFTYNKEEHEPKPVIINKLFNKEGEVLVEGVDYELDYEDNVDAGEGTCYVYGIGNYIDGFALYFTINPKDIEECEVYWDDEEEITVVKDGKRVLVEDEDYSSTVRINYYTDEGTTNKTDRELPAKETITGKGNYTGEVVLEYDVPNPNYERPKKVQTLIFNLFSGDKMLNAKPHDIFTDWLMYEINGQEDFNNLVLTCKAQTTLTYSVLELFGDPSVASIDQDGKITIHHTGEVYIAIEAAGTDEYYSASELVILNIKKMPENTGNNDNSDSGNDNTDNGNNGNAGDNGNSDSGNTGNNNSGNNNSSNGSGSTENENNSSGNTGNNSSGNNNSSTDSGSTGNNNGNNNTGNSGGNSSTGNVKSNQTITGKVSYTKTYKKNQKFSLNCKAKTALSYVSSNTKVAAVDKNGKVTIKGTGTCTITVTAKETDTYKSVVKTITITVKPQKVTLNSVKSSKKATITVKWKKVASISGYEIQYSTSSSFKNAKKVTAGSTKASATIKKLSAGKKYYVRVRAYKTVKKNGKTEKIYGAYSVKKAVKVKK